MVFPSRVLLLARPLQMRGSLKFLFVYLSVYLSRPRRLVCRCIAASFLPVRAFPFPSPCSSPTLHETEAGRRGGQRNFPNPTHLLGGVGEPPSAFHSAVRSIRNLQRARCRGLGRTERRVGFTSSSLSSLAFFRIETISDLVANLASLGVYIL